MPNNYEGLTTEQLLALQQICQNLNLPPEHYQERTDEINKRLNVSTQAKREGNNNA